MMPFEVLRMRGGGASSSGSISLNFATDAYSSGGTSYGSFAAYLSGTGSTFTRASSATYFNSSGVLATAATDTARINHDPANGNALLGLFIEPEREMRIGPSEDFTTTWVLANATATGNTTTAPDGNTTADKLAETSATNAYHQAYETGSASVFGTNVVISFFVKAAERSKVTLLLGDSTLTHFLFYAFDLSAVSVGSAQTAGSGWTANGAGISSVGGGWYRLYISGRYSLTNNLTAWVEINNASGTRQYTGTAGSGVIVWGAQYEGGTIPTSYFPVSGSSAIRRADAFTIALPSGTHNLTFTFDDNSTQVVNGLSGNYLVPTNLNRANIKSIVGVKV